MSRSDYYKRRSTRLQSTVSQPAAKDHGEGRSERIRACAVCHSDVSILDHDGLEYVQIALGCLGKALATSLCPFGLYLENGIANFGDAALSPDSVQRPVYPASVGGQNVGGSGEVRRPES
jgi:hypothetical protein